MKKLYRTLFVVLLASALSVVNSTGADTPTPKVLLNMSAGAEKRVTPSATQVTVTRSADAAAPGVSVSIQPGPEGYPGVSVKPDGVGVWDLSRFGHVEARVVNTGAKPLSVALRVDNAGDWKDNPWNTESVALEPGKSGTVSTIFGYAYGRKPSYALKPQAVVNVLLFVTKADTVQSFRIESLTADGPAGEKPPVDPASVRIKPLNGVLTGAGTRTATQGDQVTLQPAVGRWDLRDFTEVRVKVRNAGTTPAAPRVRLDSNGGPSDWVQAPALPPGALATVVVPFAGAKPIDLAHKDATQRITSDAVSGVTVAAEAGQAAQTTQIESATAVLPPAPPPPAWLGKRPPVPGDWVKTLDDEFNGPALNTSLWSVSGDNYWDKQSHWSRDDVLLGNGVVRLRYEKKTGPNNDDPAQKSSDYAAGYLHTYDRWTQRYGYFEARMKLPTAPGLWPAFWMMPDRGSAAGPEQWKRQDTANGGMEFDIMESLTRWGPTRYNIAMHYDSYGKDHKSPGSDRIYVRPDKDGYVTCGLLWTPGSAIYYANGREVLRWEDPRVSNVPEILMFTLPQGGWDNAPLEDARLPDAFVIDYVRVWQRKDLASGADGKKPTHEVPRP